MNINMGNKCYIYNNGLKYANIFISQYHTFFMMGYIPSILSYKWYIYICIHMMNIYMYNNNNDNNDNNNSNYNNNDNNSNNNNNL